MAAASIWMEMNLLPEKFRPFRHRVGDEKKSGVMGAAGLDRRHGMEFVTSNSATPGRSQEKTANGTPFRRTIRTAEAGAGRRVFRRINGIVWRGVK